MAYSCGIFADDATTLASRLARQVRGRLPQARAAAERPPARDRHRLGRPGDPRRGDTTAAASRPRPSRASSTTMRASRSSAHGLGDRDHAAARGLPRPQGPIRQAGVGRDDRGGRRALPRHLPGQVRGAAARRPAPCCCRPSRSRTRTTARSCASVNFIQRYVFPGQLHSFDQRDRRIAPPRHRPEDLPPRRTSARTTRARCAMWRAQFLRPPRPRCASSASASSSSACGSSTCAAAKAASPSARWATCRCC